MSLPHVTQADVKWTRRPTLRQKLVAVGLLGVLCAFLIAQTALSRLGEVQASNSALSTLTTAQRYQQDADMMHDALRSDVYAAMVAGRGGQGVTLARVRSDLADHVSQLHADLRGLDQVKIEGSAAQAIAAVRPGLLSYAAQAEQLATLALSAPEQAGSRLPAFEGRFSVLTISQAGATAALALQAQAAKSAAEDAERHARRGILFVSVGALAALLALVVSLDRLGRNLAILMSRERDVAETLQASLLPDRLPKLASMAFAARYVPGGQGVEVGGDWYDVIALPGGEAGLIMGDVVGHDIVAASIMGQLKNALRAYAYDGLSPSAALARLNRLTFQMGGETMATCAYAVMDPRAKTVVLASAGHYPPLLVTPDGQALLLEQASSPPVGAVREATFTEKLYHLDTGSSLVLFTDGLLERRGESVDVGLAKALDTARRAGPDVESLCERLLETFFRDRPPEDDVALLAVCLTGKESPGLRLTLPASPTELAPLRRSLGHWLEEAGATPMEGYELTVAACEAVGNSIEHAYGPEEATVDIRATLQGQEVEILVADRGRWREQRGEHRGRGLALIEEFADSMTVTTDDAGTTVSIRRSLSRPAVLAVPSGSESG